jgi:hypothetical protein
MSALGNPLNNQNLNNLLGFVNANLTNTENTLNVLLSNQYALNGLKLFLGLYAAFAAPQLPQELAVIFNYTWVRVLVAFIIVVMTGLDTPTALLLAIAFILTLQTANRSTAYSTNLSSTVGKGISWLPSSKNNLRPRQFIEQNQVTSVDMSNSDSNANNSQLDDSLKPAPFNTNKLIPYNSGSSHEEEVMMSASIPSLVHKEHDLVNTEILADIQSNTIPGSDQNSDNPLGVQGIQKVLGTCTN